MGAYPFIYLLEYTYMLIVASMAYVLMNSFVDLHHEVEELNTRLEEKINERTMDLLFRDMGTELYLRLLGELSANACEIPGAGSIERLISGRASNSLSSLSHDIGVISNTDELLNRTVSRAVDILEAEGGCLYLAGEGKDIELRASKSGRSGSTAMKPIAELAFTGRQAVNTVMRAEGGGECHVLCVPVMSGETAIGACCIENPASARGFTDNDARLLSAFMRQAAVAIGNALLYRKVKTGEKPARAHAITPLIEEKIKKAIAYIEENYTSDISRENLAASLNMHPDTLGRYFKLYTDKKISEYAAELRVRDVAARLREPGGGNIIDLAFAAGLKASPPSTGPSRRS
jgi:AraC-like DNA-binding protein